MSDKTGYGYPETTKPIGTGKNWVTETGGLPMYIRRVANQLIHSRGIPKERAIPMAVGIVEKWCHEGEQSWGEHHGTINPKSRAEACAAVAEWEAKRAASKAETAAKHEKDSK
jgi:hypothetical protein